MMILLRLLICSIVFCLFGCSLCAAAPSENKSRVKIKGVTQKGVNSDNPAGEWVSDWGPVNIKQAASRTLTGSWTEGKGKLGKILKGSYDKSKRSCNFHFVETWTGKKGTANLHLSADGRKLSGSWVRGKDNGTWEMKR